jgi:membrane protease YdiL (CAAX protease family)
LIPGVVVVSIVVAIFSSFRESHEFARQAMPSHPIQEYLANGNGMMIFLVFLTACVAAPVVEETMFRGVLYRHLRDLTIGWRRWISVIFAALLNGVIFASIHPQGIVAVPLLTTLAIGFSLAREWRGSLVCSMVMHGIHNALVTCVVLLIL